MVNLKNLIAIILVLSVILMAGCSTSEPIDNEQNNGDFEADNTTIDEISIETTNIVAIVNDEEVNSEDVSAIQQMLLQQGQQISQEDALEEAINQKLIEQKVKQENIIVTTQEAESVIEQQLSMQGHTLEDYKQQIQTQGISYEVELENLKNQIAIQKYFEEQLEGQSFNVTKEEAQEFYDNYKLQSNEEIPSYEEVESQIMATLEQQKQQQAISVIIQDLRLSANVEYK